MTTYVISFIYIILKLVDFYEMEYKRHQLTNLIHVRAHHPSQPQNSLRKIDKMLGKPRILYIFLNPFNKFD